MGGGLRKIQCIAADGASSALVLVLYYVQLAGSHDSDSYINLRPKP